MTNFDYLKEESQYSAFSNVAISAERIILADPQASILTAGVRGIRCKVDLFS